ncbi:MAG: HU family DNA-binding protein [bacterium]
MNQKQLSQKISQKLNVKRTLVEKVIEAQIEYITEALEKGDKVRFVGFGNFLVRKRVPRVGRNPQTGDRIQIPETKSPAFVAGVNLRAKIK